jgi:hypothetical protein
MQPRKAGAVLDRAARHAQAEAQGEGQEDRQRNAATEKEDHAESDEQNRDRHARGPADAKRPTSQARVSDSKEATEFVRCKCGRGKDSDKFCNECGERQECEVEKPINGLDDGGEPYCVDEWNLPGVKFFGTPHTDTVFAYTYMEKSEDGEGVGIAPHDDLWLEMNLGAVRSALERLGIYDEEQNRLWTVLYESC